MEGKNAHLFVVGTAGSGKTALVHAFSEWLDEKGLDPVTVNLDPGVEHLPYTPDVDVKDWVNVWDVMERYGVGPNGAQILSADLIALKIGEIQEALGAFPSDYIIIDTPGQMELFAYRQSSRVLLESFGISNSMIAFLFDPVLCASPAGFVSLLMLSSSIQFRFPTSFLNVLSKSDMLEDDMLDSVLNWSDDPHLLYDDLLTSNSDLQKELNIELFRALESIGLAGSLLPISSKTYAGMDDLYNAIQQTFYASEDLEPD